MRLNRNIKILLYGSNLWYFSEGMLGPLFAIFTERVGGSVLDISWAWATYLIVTGLLYILIGKITDEKYNPAKVMVLGYFMHAIFTFGYLFVNKPWHLFLIQAALGVSTALATPTWYALYSKYGDKGYETFQWGLAGGEGQILTAAAIIIGGFIVNYFSFTALFIVMGVTQLIAACYQARILFRK